MNLTNIKDEDTKTVIDVPIIKQMWNLTGDNLVCNLKE